MDSGNPKTSQQHMRHLPESLQWAMDTLLNGLSHKLTQLPEPTINALEESTRRLALILANCLEVDEVSHQQHLDEMEGRLQLIDKQSIFKGLKRPDLIMLAERLESLNVTNDTDLLTEGKPTDGVYFLVQGNVQILIGDELVAHRGPGDCFGEMSCLRGEPQASATVRTVGNCKVLRIERDQFLRAVSRTPKLWQNVFNEMSGRFNEINIRLSEVLQHSPQGLIKLDQEGLITVEFSKQCVEFFGTPRLMGRPFTEVAFASEMQLIADWESAYPLFFMDTLLDFKGVVELLPQKVVFPHPDGNFRHFEFTYYPCSDQHGQLVAIDVGIEDVTKRFELSEKRRVMENEQHIHEKLYDDPEGYIHLLELTADVTEQLHQYDPNFMPKAPLPKDGAVPVMRQLHTLKGQAGMFYLNEFRECVHLLEDCFKALLEQRGANEELSNRYTDMKNQFLDQCEYARSLLQNLSEELKRRLSGIALSSEDFEELKQVVETAPLHVVEQRLLQLEAVPTRRLFSHWPEESRHLAEQCGKQVIFTLEGENPKIPGNLVSALEAPLMHLLRNAVDHGIEPPSERPNLGKPPEGHIKAMIHVRENTLILRIGEDGRGLDMPSIIKKARQNPHLDRDQVDRLIQIGLAWKLIFLPGFSTAKSVTNISGRGVGLDAVDAAVQQLNGQIEVVSQPRQGTTFVITIPLA